jgi:winged helix DNA-binding protein
MTNSDIARQRLLNQHIVEPTFKSPTDVVAWLGAVQAQEYADAKWALGLRMENATDAIVEQAFNEGAILRTHLMRPTWHFVTPADIRWILELTAPRVHARNAYYERQLELDGALFRRSDAVIAKALRGGKHLLRSELGSTLARAGIVAKTNRLSHIMHHAELEGIVCSGPRRGKQFTYALLNERVPQAKTLVRDEALAELTRRYFTSHGPATVRDFAWWSGLTVADVKVGLALSGSQLSQEVIDGQTYWFSSSTRVANDRAMKAYLLPVFDEYTVAYKDRSAVFERVGRNKLGGSMDILLTYAIVVGGQIVGTWEPTLKKDTLVIETNLFTGLTTIEKRAIAAAAQRYGDFLQLPAKVV